MANTHSADEPGERGSVKDIPNHPVGLALVETALVAAGDDAARVLSAMLEKREALADLRSSIDRRVVEEETEDTAHCCDPGLAPDMRKRLVRSLATCEAWLVV